jgi:hypothetical protein
MRVLSNACLNAAVLTRRVGPVFRLFITSAFKARKLERKFEPPTAGEIEESRREELNARIRLAIQQHQAALAACPAYDPTDKLPPVQFERILLNGSFKVTPALREAVKKGVRDRRERGVKTALLVVANKTNTVVSLGLGKRGNEGGVRVPHGNGTLEVEPIFLTDHASRTEWLRSADFRAALAKGWITVLPATAR